METFSALLAFCAGNSPVPGELPAQGPMTRSFDVFFDLRLNKPFSKQSWGWWFETPSRPLWRHCNEGMRVSKTRSYMARLKIFVTLNTKTKVHTIALVRWTFAKLRRILHSCVKPLQRPNTRVLCSAQPLPFRPVKHSVVTSYNILYYITHTWRPPNTQAIRA